MSHCLEIAGANCSVEALIITLFKTLSIHQRKSTQKQGETQTLHKYSYGRNIGSIVLTISYCEFRVLCYVIITLVKLIFLSNSNFQRVYMFLTAILHRGLRNDFFLFLQPIYFFPFSIWTFISLFFLDFYFPFLFGLLFPFSIWTFILFRFVLKSF